MNQYAAACSRKPDLRAAVDEVCRGISEQGLKRCDVLFAFAMTGYGDELDELPRRLRQSLEAAHVVGCSAEMLVGGGREIEAGPGLSVWAARFDGAALEPFRLEFSQTADGLMMAGLPEPPTDASDTLPAHRTAFVFGDPFSAVPGSIIDRLKFDWPNTPLLGGMASGAAMPGDHRLFLDDEAHRSGAVGLFVTGGPHIGTVVSQGCRPIGPQFIVTRAEQNIIHELGGKPALAQFREVFGELSEAEQQTARRGLHLGIAMHELRDRFDRGDFLIANVLGADPNIEAIAISNTVRVGQTVRFHLRDAAAADEDLRSLLADEAGAADTDVEAALLFSCNGRGTRLFEQPDHDITALLEAHPAIPAAGFFAQGEFGPVADQNYIHGFTASIALFHRNTPS